MEDNNTRCRRSATAGVKQRQILPRKSESTVFMPHRHGINGMKPVWASPWYECLMAFQINGMKPVWTSPGAKFDLIPNILCDKYQIQYINSTITIYISLRIRSSKLRSHESEVQDIHNSISVHIVRVFSWDQAGVN